MPIALDMERDYGDTRRPASDTDGSEDVFLDLAQSDDETEQPASRLSHRKTGGREDHNDDLEHTIRNLPGQFPDRSAQPKDTTNSRPRSSGYLSRGTGQLGSMSSRHARHVSIPQGPSQSQYLDNLSAMRHNRQVSSRYADSSQRYADLRDQLSPNTETPRLRRQKRLYADQDGYFDEPTQQTPYANGSSYQRGSRRPSLNPTSPMRPSPTSAMNQVMPNDSDSVGSQTAASTVWDELDDLKTRIKRLESSGRMPSTANAAIAQHTSARPQTATTAPTTVSSSPQQARKQPVTSTESANASTVPANVHPTLQSALERAKSTLKPHVLRPLEATVMDSLALAAATGRQNNSSLLSSAASTANGFGTGDRQTRRKVDSLCRNLADLCISMCDARAEEAQVLSSPVSARKPASPRNAQQESYELRDEITPSAMQSRRGSLAATSRLDRYRSTRGTSISGRQDLPDDMTNAERSPSTTPKDYTARYSSITRAEPQGYDRRRSQIEPEQEQSIRAPSRAMTELGGGRTGLNLKRDHLQTGAQRSPSLRETLEARRRSANIREDEVYESQSSVGGVGGHTPATRRFLERVRGPPSEVSGVSSAARPRQGSQDLYAQSPRLTTPLTRNTSLSKRRFATE